jgi:hypothetical protein
MEVRKSLHAETVAAGAAVVAVVPAIASRTIGARPSSWPTFPMIPRS